jgi:serine/threonine-protein kinase
MVATIPAEERYYPEESRYDEMPRQPVERKERSIETPVAKQASPTDNEEKIEKTESRPKETTDRSLLKEIRSQVSVKSNNYDVGSFGGIRNLQLTVNNDSKYTLDQVVVELQYLKPRDEFLKSEHISFHDIGPKDSKTVAIPKSTRGVKVSFKILRIESKEVNNATAGL